MAVARDALVRGGQSLDRIAEDIGYESASAFSTAFRKRIGCAGQLCAHLCQRAAGVSRMPAQSS
jgi:AraC-like DNA-binding protein